MAKKYVPSGYQIINIDCSDKTSGTPFDPVTEDEILLCKILYDVTSEGINKPILLKCIDTDQNMWCGFPSICNNRATLTDGIIGSSKQVTLWSDGSQLEINYAEE